MPNYRHDFWVIDPLDMTRVWMGQTEKNLRLRVARLAERYRDEIEAYMKAQAAWTDRTTLLRQTLYADIDFRPDVIKIYFDYSQRYGAYLEFRPDLAGRFAIVNPTFDRFAPRFLNEVTTLLNDL